MSEPQRRRVRVRRSPKVGVFLLLGAVVGALAAAVAVSVTPADESMSAAQAIGFLIVLLAPLGALLGGVVALVLDAVLERRGRTVDAERLPTAAPVVPPSEAEDAAPAEQVPDRSVDQERSDRP
jgi:hypothetical protein